VLHQIGNGALGPVFRAYDSDRDRLVAIKVFRLDLPPERVHQLVAEFEQLIAAELQHPVIAAPRAAGIDAGNNAFLAQDFAAADSLDIVVRENGRAQLANTLRVASQLAEALDYAADRQVLHGALHPRDILLSEDDIRIVGVGVSRALERVGVTTPVRRPYSAPERINDEGWDQRADVFSLAAIVYELLSGKRVAGTGSEAAESLTDVAGCDVAALQRVFALALAADPSYRFATATAFTDALKEAAADTADSADVSAPKQKHDGRVTLKVVTPPDDVEELVLSDFEEPPPDEIPELTLTDVEAAAPVEEPSLPLIAFADDLQEQLAAEPPPKIRLPRRRKVPAPTPVAIETVASADLLQPAEPAAEPAPIEHLDLAVETPFFQAPALDRWRRSPSPAYEEPLVFEQPPAFEELPVAHEFVPGSPRPVQSHGWFQAGARAATPAFLERRRVLRRRRRIRQYGQSASRRSSGSQSALASATRLRFAITLRRPAPSQRPLRSTWRLRQHQGHRSSRRRPNPNRLRQHPLRLNNQQSPCLPEECWSDRHHQERASSSTAKIADKRLS
jgi:hypothetical protein